MGTGMEAKNAASKEGPGNISSRKINPTPGSTSTKPEKDLRDARYAVKLNDKWLIETHGFLFLLDHTVNIKEYVYVSPEHTSICFILNSIYHKILT